MRDVVVGALLVVGFFSMGAREMPSWEDDVRAFLGSALLCWSFCSCPSRWSPRWRQLHPLINATAGARSSDARVEAAEVLARQSCGDERFR
jgi:hypothetical protein